MKNGFRIPYEFHANGEPTDGSMIFFPDGSFVNPYFGPHLVEKSDLTQISQNQELIFRFDFNDAWKAVEIKITSNRIDTTLGLTRDGASHQIIGLDPFNKQKLAKWLVECYQLAIV